MDSRQKEPAGGAFAPPLTAALLCLAVVALLCAASAARADEGTAVDLFDPSHNPAFERLTIDDGLPENSVRAMIQDRNGFVWLGTQNGLVRYDGYEMLAFTPSAADSTSFGGRTVDALYEDGTGDIWIGTFLAGLWRLDGEDGGFRRVQLPDKTGAGAQHVTDIRAVAANELWVATANGLISMDRETEAAHWHDAVSTWLSDSDLVPLTAVLPDDRGRIWCASEGAGVAIYDPASRSLRRFRHDPRNPRSLADDTVYDLFQGQQGRIWLATRGGLCLWQDVEEGFQRFVPRPDLGAGADPNVLISMTQDSTGLLWIGTVTGLGVFDPLSWRFRRYSYDENRSSSPVNGVFLSVMVDRSGLIWAGSWQAGLVKSDPRAGTFQVGRFPLEELELPSAPVESIVEDRQGRLWIGIADKVRSGSLGAMFVREPGATTFHRLTLAPHLDRPLPAVKGLLEDEDGTIYIATAAGLWQVVDGAVAPASEHHRDLPEFFRTGNLKDLAVDRQGRLWVASWEGLRRWDRATNEVRVYRHDPDDPHSLSWDDPVRLYVDGSGRLWVGSDTRGLNLYRPASDDFRVFFAPEQGLDTVSDIHETSGGVLWLASYAGLVRFDPSTGSTQVYDRRSGLPNDQVVSILEGTAGTLWASTSFGMASFDPSTGEVRRYDSRDGLPSNEVMFAHCKGADGRAYFGGSSGIVSFDPTQFEKSGYLPPVVITRIEVQDVPLAVGPRSPLPCLPNLARRIELPHDQNDVAFGFASLDFGRPGLNRYAYRLDGAHDNWRDPGSTRRAAYTNLRPDTYVFRVRASNRDGVWNDEGAFIELRILPPWWQTHWAFAAYAVLGILLVWGAIRQITQRERMQAKLAVQRAEAEKLHEIDQLKTRFLTSITHEFRTPLTLIKAPLHRIWSEQDSPKDERVATMIRNADRLEQLIDQLLDLSRLEARRLPIKWQYSDCVAYLGAFMFSFDSLAARRGIRLTVEVPKESMRAWYDPDLVEKIVGNLLSNAVKHTPDEGRIVANMRFGLEAHRRAPRMANDKGDPPTALARELQITISNSGSFIPPGERERIFDRFYQASTAGGSGVGLSLVKELTELLGGGIELRSDPERGTSFLARMPVFLEHPEGESADPALASDSASDHPVGAGEGDLDATEDSGSEPQVLVVEDNHDLRRFMASDLSREFRVLEAKDGETGFETAIEEIPDLVLSDVMMPGMDGFELCRRLKEDERTSHVPVILLTALSEAESRHEGLRLGADDYVAKPFDAEDLRLRIANLITQRRKLAEKYERKLAMLTPESMPVTSTEERFIAQLRRVIDANLADSEFKINELCREVAMSRSQLHRKLKAVTGRSTTAFVRAHRLQRAAQLLEGGYGNVTEVALAVGFLNLSYFSRSFRELYGMQPSEYVHRDRRNEKKNQA